MEPAEAKQLVDADPLWYHTMELAPGVVTPGWFDLRPIIDRFPWPDVRGKRCLDVGTFDGHLAFELERRGAAEVIATDIPGHEDWDWPADFRVQGPERLAEVAGPKGNGFEIAKKVLGSNVERRWVNVYDLDPGELGTFDVVVCGALLLHLQNPVKAVERLRTMCGPGGKLLSVEQVNLSLTLAHPRKAVAQLNGSGRQIQWWVANRAGHQRMLYAGGFAVERVGPLLSGAFGPAHPPVTRSLRVLRQRLTERVMTRGFGVPVTSAVASPRI